MFLHDVFSWNFFSDEGFLISQQERGENVRSFPSSFRLVPHNVSGIPATLWVTMWPECEEFVSLNENAYYQITFGILLTIPSHFSNHFLRKKEFFCRENSTTEKTS